MSRTSHAIISLIIILLVGISSAHAAETMSTEAAKPATETREAANPAAEGTSDSTIEKTSTPSAESKESTQPTAEPKPKTSTTTKSSTSTTTKSSSSAAKTSATKKPKLTRTIDTQVSGYTSQDSDSIYGRLSVEEKRDGKTWYARGSVTRTSTHVTRTSHVLTYRLDSRHERMRNAEEYNVFTAVVSTRDRNSSTRVRKSGYQLVSYGTGKQWDPKTKGEIGLGLVNVRDEDTGVQAAIVAGLRASRPLSTKLTLNSDFLAIQPIDELRSTKLDSDIGLAYQMSPGFYLRLGWQATNLIRSAYTYKEWDSTVRLSISWRRTTTD